jgi:hypothetical protein
MTGVVNVGVFIRENVWLENTATFSNLVILHTYPPMKMEQSVPKRRHIKFRSRGITQKKAYSISSYLPAYEDGTDRAFRNVGIQNSEAGELPRRKRTTENHNFEILFEQLLY